MAGKNLQFEADVAEFSKQLEVGLEAVVTGVAREMCRRLQEATPFRSGRASASWNIGIDEPDLTVPEQILGERYWDATDQELGAARAHYKAIEQETLAKEVPRGTKSVFVSNDLDYIEQLNAGSSQQAPPAFFEATVAGLETVVNEQIAKLQGGPF